MATKKEQMLKTINEFLDSIFPKVEDKPIEVIEQSTEVTELAAPVEEIPTEVPVEEVKPIEVKDLPDGEYMIVVKGGMIEVAEPKEVEPEVEVIEDSTETKMSSDDIKLSLQKEFDVKLAEQKEAFEIQLKKLAEAKQASGIIQAPVEVKTEPRVYTAKEIIMKNAEEKRNK